MANGKPLPKQKDLPKKKRVKSVSKLKEDLDAVFSKYVRNKYAVDGYVACYTCPKVKPVSEMTNGHFVSRRHLATRFDERNCRPQCWGCQAKHLGNGMPVEFARKLSLEYGEKIIDILYRKAQEIVKNYPYEEKIEEYKKKLENLNG